MLDGDRMEYDEGGGSNLQRSACDIVEGEDSWDPGADLEWFEDFFLLLGVLDRARVGLTVY